MGAQESGLGGRPVERCLDWLVVFAGGDGGDWVTHLSLVVARFEIRFQLRGLEINVNFLKIYFKTKIPEL